MSPSSDFWLIELPTGPEDYESLVIDYPSAPCAFAVFTSEENAWEYQKACLGPRWEIASTSHTDLAGLLAELAGDDFVVFDPAPHGTGRVVPLFQALVELA